MLMLILTTAEISRKKLEEIINFGKKKKLITQEQASDLTNSVNKNSNIAQSKEARKIKQIELKDEQLRQLIKIQEERIHELKEPLPFRESLPYLMVLYIPTLCIFFLVGAIAATIAASYLLAFGYLTCISLIVAFCYGINSQPSLSTLENTLTTLKKFDVSANHSIPTHQTSPDENSSKNQPESEKIQHSSTLGFFSAAAPTSEDVDSFSKPENTPQYKN